VHVGEWKDGKAHGKGTRRFPDGTTQYGTWKDGKPWEGTHYDEDDQAIAWLKKGVVTKSNGTDSTRTNSTNTKQEKVISVTEENLKKLLETKECPKCDLSAVNLTGENLIKANLNEANLKKATLLSAKLNLANLSSANLTNANLAGAILAGASLSRATLKNANLDWVTFQGANLTSTDLTGATLKGAKNFKTANMAGAIFCKTTMPDGLENNSGC